jgi:hypothetical protein
MKAKKIFENIDFERGKDPKKSMGIGMSPEQIYNADTISGTYDKDQTYFDHEVLKNMEKCGDSMVGKDGNEFNSINYMMKNYGNPYRFIKYEDKVYPIPNKNPYKIRESYNFERGKNIKEQLFPWKPGKVLISSTSNDKTFNIWMYSGKEGQYNEIWDIGKIRKKPTGWVFFKRIDFDKYLYDSDDLRYMKMDFLNPEEKDFMSKETNYLNHCKTFIKIRTGEDINIEL